MTTGLHLPTAIVVATTLVLLWVLGQVIVRARRPRGGFLSDADRATHETLHTASLAARELREGLDDSGVTRAAPHLRAMLGTPSIAVCDPTGPIVWEGVGEHHLTSAHGHAEQARRTGRTVALTERDVRCPDPDCPVRAAVVTPIVADGRLVGTIAAYGPSVTSGLALALEEVARLVADQVELAELDLERTRAVEAELRALRAQISPHFVYNSLAAIATFVRTDPDRARELLLEFADFTRYALRRGGAFTTLREELQNVERYLVLEQARFGDRLRISLRIDPAVLPVRVPYLAIQPLVENAVRHGLAPKEGPGHVTLTATDRGTDVEVSIEDDGVGADPEHVRRVLDGQLRTDSVGLGNVDARLRQVYGPAAGLVVDTARGAGTRVAFRVPKFQPHETD